MNFPKKFNGSPLKTENGVNFPGLEYTFSDY